MKRILFPIFLTFLSFIAFAQKSPAELLVEDTGYEYLLQDSNFVYACNEMVFKDRTDSIEILLSNKSMDDRLFRIFSVRSGAIFAPMQKAIDNNNIAYIKENLSSSKKKLTDLEKEAEGVLSKENLKEYKRLNKLIRTSLSMMKLFLIGQ